MKYYTVDIYAPGKDRLGTLVFRTKAEVEAFKADVKGDKSIKILGVRQRRPEQIAAVAG